MNRNSAVKSIVAAGLNGCSADFPILHQSVNGCPLVFLDSAASSQRPQSVIDAVTYYETHDFSSTSLDTGSDLTRNEVTVRLNGAGASCDIVGVYLVNTRQHIDNHIHVDHLAKDTRSSQEFVGIAGGHARAIFNSKVHVHPGADGTDATQTNRNLLLSNQAEVDTKPELEIYADDVNCSHGATTGQLDEAALFYLKSRGLGEQAARELLVYAFVEATLSQIGEESLHRMYERVVKTALGSLLKDNPLQ